MITRAEIEAIDHIEIKQGTAVTLVVAPDPMIDEIRRLALIGHDVERMIKAEPKRAGVAS